MCIFKKEDKNSPWAVTSIASCVSKLFPFVFFVELNPVLYALSVSPKYTKRKLIVTKKNSAVLQQLRISDSFK